MRLIRKAGLALVVITGVRYLPRPKVIVVDRPSIANPSAAREWEALRSALLRYTEGARTNAHPDIMVRHEWDINNAVAHLEQQGYLRFTKGWGCPPIPAAYREVIYGS